MKLSRTIVVILWVVINIAVDQISKIWVRANVDQGSVTELLGNYLTLRNVENDGAFLGMGGDLNPTLKLILLLILPTLVLGAVLVHIIREKEMDKLSLIGYSAVVGGGIANIFDRFRFGHVTDFLHIDLGGVFRTGIFNAADMSVTGGLILILWAGIKYRKKQKSA